MLFLVLLAALVAFLLIIKLLTAMSGRVTERMLTRYFRSAEALLDSDELPAEWGDQLQRMAHRGTVRTQLIRTLPWEEAAKPFLMKKLKALRSFFETYPFVESPEVRAMMLELFDAVAARWEGSDLSDILDYYDVSIEAR